MSGWPINCRECGPVVTNPAQHRYWHANEGLAAPKAGRPPRRNKRQEIRALDAARALRNDSPSLEGQEQDDPACSFNHTAARMKRNQDGDLECWLCGYIRYEIPPDVAEEVADGIRSHAPRLPGE